MSKEELKHLEIGYVLEFCGISTMNGKVAPDKITITGSIKTGRVYKGNFKGQDVALKTNFDENEKAIYGEFKKKQQDSGCISYLGYNTGNSDIPRFLVFEFFSDNLSHYVSSDMAFRLSLFRQLHNAMTHLHKHNIMHGDIKLENVLVRRDEVKFCDLDNAHSFGEDCTASTIGWESPEIMTARKLDSVTPASAKIDLFGIGLIASCLSKKSLEPFPDMLESEIGSLYFDESNLLIHLSSSLGKECVFYLVIESACKLKPANRILRHTQQVSTEAFQQSNQNKKISEGIDELKRDNKKIQATLEMMVSKLDEIVSAMGVINTKLNDVLKGEHEMPSYGILIPETSESISD